MAFELIPFPISILFVLVFGIVWMVVLWKLRRRGKIYSILFKLSLIAEVVFFIMLFYAVVAKMIG